MERPKFFNEEVYHIYNRGVAKRDIFTTERDYFRFIQSMYEFNDLAPSLNLNFYFQSKPHPEILRVLKKPRKDLVEILCFVLMPNHYHFLLRQLREGGITEFMRKIGTGYTKYFNIKNQRVGPLFQGKFKAVHITKEPHLLYLPHYIHLNPLDLSMPEWREQRIRDVKSALNFLKSYRWSSYLDYIGKKNFPSLIYRSPTSIVGYEQEIAEWLKDFNFEQIQDATIEVGLR